jgi:hypothetical protein
MTRLSVREGLTLAGCIAFGPRDVVDVERPTVRQPRDRGLLIREDLVQLGHGGL